MAESSKSKKLRLKLGPVEQAQIVTSTAVLVSLITIIVLRITSAKTIDWLLFGNVLTVGIFGFIIVYFTIKFGRILEEQKEELIALNLFTESITRAIEVQQLLKNAINEMRRLLDIEYGWVYFVEGDTLLLKVSNEVNSTDFEIIGKNKDIHNPEMKWLYSPHIERKPKGKINSDTVTWNFEKISSWASVPIIIKNQLMGVIILASSEREKFSKREIDLMIAFSNQIGVALENATLFEKVRKSEERYMELFEHSPDMSHIINETGTIISCNQTEANKLGYSKNEIIGQSFLKLYPNEYHQEAKQILDRILKDNQQIQDLEEKMVKKDGTLIDVSINASVIRDENGQLLVRAVARDITEKKNLEARVLHAQRIDSIGKLAGGVAHDFNNILTSILGSTAIMKRKMNPNDQWYRFADIIETAARRGASLTKQLLTFARKGTIQFRPVIVNDIIEETIKLFERSTDKTYVVKKYLTQEPCIISGDDGQIQQSILNLLLNARDAMPNGGIISVRSEKKRIDKFITFTGEIKEGDFVSVSVEDTGIGIEKGIQQHIFDPFFTTKEPGKGTGLGLSVVYGVVNAHNGFITVESEPNRGSKFTMFFPLISMKEPTTEQTKSSKLKYGNEKVLVVDDEKDVANVVGGMLESLGYKVTIVDSGQKAVNLLKKKKKFDVVVLDLNMPKMSGKVTFTKIRKINPKLKVIISTGYSDKDMDLSKWPGEIDAFLQKPYQLQELSETMRKVLDNQN